MKLLMTVFMIRFIISLLDKKSGRTKDNNNKSKEVKHPAAFNIRFE